MPDSRRFWFSRKSPDAVTPETSPETPADKPTTLSSEDPPDITPSHAVTEKKYIFRQKSQSPQNGKNGQKICSFDWSWQLTEYNLHT